MNPFLLTLLLLSHPEAKPAITALALVPGEAGFVQGSQAGVVFHSLDGKEKRSLTTQLDHVHALAFSPDGKVLASAGGSPAEAGVVALWSWPEGKLLGKLEAHQDVVYDVVWLDQGKRLATAGGDRTVRLWDAHTRRELAKLSGHSGPVLALAVSPDGRWLCSGSADHTIRVWDPVKPNLIRSMTNHLGPVHRLAFRPGKGEIPRLASAGDGTVRLWQPSIGRLVRILRQPAPVLALAWSPDDGRLFTGGQDGVLREFAGDSDRLLREEKISPQRITTLACGTKRLLIGHSGRVQSAPSGKKE